MPDLSPVPGLLPDAPRHIVAVAGIIRDGEGRVLLVHTNWRGWEPPGGQVELGEDVITALHREIAEESGVQVAVGALVGLYCNTGTPSIVQMLFACAYYGGSLHGSAETSDVRWFTPEEALCLPVRPATQGRLQDALRPGPGVIYRVYRTQPHYQVLSEHYLG